jgi:hypothetical protein
MLRITGGETRKMVPHISTKENQMNINEKVEFKPVIVKHLESYLVKENAEINCKGLNLSY